MNLLDEIRKHNEMYEQTCKKMFALIEKHNKDIARQKLEAIYKADNPNETDVPETIQKVEFSGRKIIYSFPNIDNPDTRVEIDNTYKDYVKRGLIKDVIKL